MATTPTVSFKNTAYRGSEGDTITIQLLVSGVEDMTTTLQNALNNCKIGTLVSSFFAHNAASPGQDIDSTFDITWGELQNGEILGTAEALLHKDDEKEDIEGVLLYIKNSSKKLKTEPPAYALLLIEDKVDASAPFFAKALEDSSKPPQERSHYIFNDVVVSTNRQSFSTTPVPGWFGMLTANTNITSRGGRTLPAPPFTDIFAHDGVLYGITIKNPQRNNGEIILHQSLCARSYTKEGEESKLYWEKITYEELSSAAIAANYDQWGEFGNLFGGDRNERRRLPQSIAEQLAARRSRNSKALSNK